MRSVFNPINIQFPAWAMGLFLMVVSVQAIAQEAAENDFKHHKISLSLSHTHSGQGIGDDGSKEWIVLPSWGLDYDYRFNEKWALGVHGDMVMESFAYEGEDNISAERTRPIAVAVVGSHSFGKHLSVMAGGGAEFSPEENLALVRLGFDYAWELPGDWEVAVSLVGDIKIDAYNALVFGFEVARAF